MKTFITSYLISFAIITSLSFSDVMLRPLDLLPRIAVYLAFPLAFVVSAVIIIVSSYFGISGGEESVSTAVAHEPMDSVKSGQSKAA
ncbi:hypothetical protein KKA14_18100 [bacterium]|nr:hypothetical protein [bacterium]